MSGASAGPAVFHIRPLIEVNPLKVVQLVRLLVAGDRHGKVLDGEAGRVEEGDLVVSRATLRLAEEDPAELGDVLSLERARLDRPRDVTVVARLLPLVDDDTGTGELLDEPPRPCRARPLPSG